MSATPTQPVVALVLAGGGARGAYEAGALSVLLPVLEERGERPRMIIGTSIGALTASFLAARADVSVDTVIADAIGVWEAVNWAEILRPLLSGGSLLRLSEYIAEVFGVPGARLESLLDPDPLRATLRQRIDFTRIERNVAAGALEVAAVVATSALTGRSVVFHAGCPSPPADLRRGIDYVGTGLTEDQMLSFLLFAPEFAEALVALGRQDAQRWIDEAHDFDDLWQLGEHATASGS